MSSNRSGSLSIFKIASAYIGTVVGAGFASGQEVLQFFSTFGWSGLWGIAIASGLFVFTGYSVLLFGMKLKANSHVEVVRFTNGKVLGLVIDVIITLFLFGALSAMIAGAGAIFQEQFGIAAIWGNLFMALITLLTVITGTKGVINAISYVVPFLILSVLAISVYNLVTNPISQSEISKSASLIGATPNWLLSSINYVSYNLVIAIAVLAPMGSYSGNERKLLGGALFGGLGLGLGIIAINLCVLTNIFDVSGTEVPMITIASKISGTVKLLFTIVLFAEVYTTAVGNLYGFVRRTTRKIPRMWVIAGITILSFSVAQFGFSNLVKYLYPAVGYGGILFIVGIVYAWIAKRDSLQVRQ